MRETDIRDIFEQEARNGNGHFAIALALLMISRSLDRIGSDEDAERTGSFEYLTGALLRIAKALEESH